MHRQSLHFEKLLEPIEPRGYEEVNPFQDTAEFRLLDEVKDISEELRIIQDVAKQQALVLQGLADNSRGKVNDSDEKGSSGIDKIQAKRMDYFLVHRPKILKSAVDDLVNKASSTGNAILHLLDLKQKQANIFEARSATKMARESEKSSETIMLVRTAVVVHLEDLLTMNSSPLLPSSLSVAHHPFSIRSDPTDDHSSHCQRL